MLIVYIGLLVLSFLFPKSKKVAFLAVLFIFVMYSFVYYKGDLQTYEWIYRDYGINLFDTTFEPGFNAILLICKKAGFSFTAFRMVLATIYIALLYKGISINTKYIALAISLSTVFPLIVFVSVLRSGIACMILLNGYNYLFDEKAGNKGILKYLLVVVIASLFHYSSALMIILVFAKKQIRMEKVFKYLVGTVVITVLLSQADVLYVFVSQFTDRAKTLQWFSTGEGTANITGAIAIIIVLLMNYYIAYKSKVISAPYDSMPKSREERLVDFCYHSSIILFFLFPLMMFASPFLRLLYMMVPLVIANSLNAEFKMKRRSIINSTITFQGVLLFGFIILIRIYHDLPYIGDGYLPFQELLKTQFILY